MLLILDNNSQFTNKLVELFKKIHQTIFVFQNSKVTPEKIKKLNPNYIVISPGPGRPENSGISPVCVEKFAGKIPILGVCLGHEVIAQVFGTNIIDAKMETDGVVSDIYHNNSGVFKNIVNPFKAARYHSYVADKKTLSRDFEITAWTENENQFDEIMGIKHKTLAIEGIQFHPEAILTEYGVNILKNFITTYQSD